MEDEYQILLFYKYLTIEQPESMRLKLREICEKLELTGRLIVAREGLNITVEGKIENTQAFENWFKSQDQFADIHFKRSPGNGQSFPKLSVKTRQEIVSLHLGEANFSPWQKTGKYITPTELHELFESGKEFYIIDMRNDYEHLSGHFEGSILPPMRNFRELPEIIPSIVHLKDKKIVTVCTGGVRCEKASGYLINQEFTDVSQLAGGIVSYMEQFPNQHFLGKLYVFDQRVLMGFNTDSPEHVIVGRCAGCDGSSERYVNCYNEDCHKHYILCQKCDESNGRYCTPKCRQKFFSSQKVMATSIL
jgi:UPF0176 protein